MMKSILNAMRLQAQRNASEQRDTSVGLVTSYDPDNFAVRVQLQAEEILTGWLPLCSPWIGNGWGMFAAPSVGDMVEVCFFGGAIEAGFVVGRLFNDIDRPLSVPSGEFWLVHKTGTLLQFTTAGDVILTSARDLVATVGRNLTANVSGNIDIACDGNAGVTVQGNATATVNGTASVTVAEDCTIGVGGDATATVTGALDVTATAATINSPTTVNGATTINGALIVNGATTLNGPLSQTAGAPGGTAANLVGPLTVTNDVSANGTSVHTHVHGGVTTGSHDTSEPL
jgi:phage baseplate assembly protein V